MSAPLELDAVTAGYDGAAAVRGLSLTVEAGEMVALVGANGAGKTTTLRAVSGLIGLMNGDVRVLGRSIQGQGPTRVARRGLAHVPEGRGIFFSLTVAEHFRLERVDPARGYARFPALEPLANRRAGVLSGGEQQMLALACALVRSPRVLLVDELSLGLAPVIVERLLGTISRVAGEHGTAVLLVEQHVELALEFANRGVVLAHGEIVLTGSAAELREDRQLVAASYLGAPTGGHE